MKSRITEDKSKDNVESGNRYRAWRAIYVDPRFGNPGDEKTKWTVEEAAEFAKTRELELAWQAKSTGRKAVPVNINQHPPKDKIEPYLYPHKVISLGDLHANAMKLIYTLIQERVMQLTPTQQSSQSDLYNRLLKIYLKPVNELTKADLDTFKTIINDATFDPAAKTILIRLIGDEVGDRGSNDYFVFLIIKKLIENKVPVESLYSNHAGELFNACESVYAKEGSSDVFAIDEDSPEWVDPNDPHAVRGIDNFPRFWVRLGATQGASLENLGALIQRGLVTKEEVVDLIKTYMPIVNAVSYEIDPKHPNGVGFTFNAHAPIGVKTLIALAKYFDIPFNRKLAETWLPGDRELPKLLLDKKSETDSAADTKELSILKLNPYVCEVARVIEQINEKFNKLKTETLKALEGKPTQGGVYALSRAAFHKEQFRQGIKWEKHKLESPSFDHPLCRIPWVRFASDDKNDVRPEKIGDAFMYFMHGHDSPAENKKNVIGLDNAIAKANSNWQGEMETWNSFGMTLTQLLTLAKLDDVRKQAEATSVLETKEVAVPVHIIAGETKITEAPSQASAANPQLDNKDHQPKESVESSIPTEVLPMEELSMFTTRPRGKRVYSKDEDLSDNLEDKNQKSKKPPTAT